MIGLSPHTGLAGVQRTEDRDLAEWPTAGAKALPGEEERRQERGGKWGAWESREKQRVKWGGGNWQSSRPTPRLLGAHLGSPAGASRLSL